MMEEREEIFQDLISEAYFLLYEEPLIKYNPSIKYSKRLKDYNARVKIIGSKLDFHLSSSWKDIDKDIQIGLVQELLARVLKKPRNTIYLDLYHNFIKKLHLVAPKSESHPKLEDSFNRVNERYFFGMLESPNLLFGSKSKRTMGTYNFQTDTITISKILYDAPERLLDYIMYHEMLHKKLKFNANGLRYSYHSGEFRKKEKEFEDSDKIDKELNRFLRWRR